MSVKNPKNNNKVKKSAELTTTKPGKEKEAKKSGGSGKRLKLDPVLWLLIIILVIAGIATNSYYNQLAGALRAAGGIVLAIVIIGIAAMTSQGQQAWTFIKGSRTELRKVVWPTRQETVQTTLIVVAMVLIMALVLWGLDSLFLWAVSWLTGQ